MNKSGHTGLGLLVYTPVAFAVLALGAIDLFILGFVLTMLWVNAPDIDLVIPGVAHRGLTHTLAAAVTAGVLTGIATGGLLGTGIPPVEWPTTGGVGALEALTVGGYAAVITFASVGSHILGDAATPMGVQPLQPWSKRHYSLRLMRADNRLVNGMVAIAGWLAVSGAVVIAFPAFTGGNL